MTEHNIKVTQIYTNGLLVSEKLLNEFDRMNVRPEFVMSYDGAGWHDWMRSVNGAEEAVNRAFAVCREKGFSTMAEMCFHRLNMHTLRESINHLASLGVGSLKVSGVMNTGNGKLTVKLKIIRSVSVKYSMYISIICLITTRTICPLFGRVLPCMPMAGSFIEEKMPFIQEHGLAECINNSYWLELVNLRLCSLFEHNEECRTCEFSDKCSGGCRAAAMSFDYDNYFGKDLMACKLFKGKWAEKVIAMMKKIKPEAKISANKTKLLFIL